MLSKYYLKKEVHQMNKKKIIVSSLLILIIAFSSYLYIALHNPKPTGYYMEDDDGTFFFNDREYLYITSSVEAEIGEKLGLVVYESDYKDKTSNFDVFNWLSVNDEAFRLKEMTKKTI